MCGDGDMDSGYGRVDVIPARDHRYAAGNFERVCEYAHTATRRQPAILSILRTTVRYADLDRRDWTSYYGAAQPGGLLDDGRALVVDHGSRQIAARACRNPMHRG